MMKKWSFGILLVYMLSCFIGCGTKTEPIAEEDPYGDEYVWISRFYNLGEDYNESSLFDTFGMDIQEGELIYALRPFSLVKPIHKNTIELQTMEGTDIPIEPEQSAKEDAYSVGWAGFEHQFNNVDIPVYAKTKEQIDVLEAFLDQPLAAREIANNREKEMYLIFNEEVQPYLLGQKSAEDVAKIIQSRLQLYLEED